MAKSFEIDDSESPLMAPAFTPVGGVPMIIPSTRPFPRKRKRFEGLIGCDVGKIRHVTKTPAWSCGFEFNEWHIK